MLVTDGLCLHMSTSFPTVLLFSHLSIYAHYFYSLWFYQDY